MNTRALIDQELAGLPEFLQREVYDFVRFLRSKSGSDDFNGLLASEALLVPAIGKPLEEGVAWQSL